MISPSHAAGFHWKIPSRSGEGKAARLAIPISERFEIDLTPPSDSFAFCQSPLRCRVSLARVLSSTGEKMSGAAMGGRQMDRTGNSHHQRRYSSDQVVGCLSIAKWIDFDLFLLFPPTTKYSIFFPVSVVVV